MNRYGKWLICLGAVTLGWAGAVTDQIHTRLMTARESAGNSLLERRSTLDTAAILRAERIAARPHTKRLSDASALDLTFPGDEHRYRRTVERLILLKGIAPAQGVPEKWKAQASSWETLTRGEWNAIGYGTARADDGWFVFVAILAEDLAIRDSPDDIRQAEQFVFQSINGIRREQNLIEMELSSELSDVARKHSQEMAEFDRFAHEGADGSTSAERVDGAGISYMGVAENIVMNNNPDQAMQQAVQDWMNSPTHRKNILDDRFHITGVGVAVSEDGRYYFTQMFLFE
jgi:uncharacterized protein YkwD